MTPRRRILPIFVPHAGCPNDCVFCNQKRISGSLLPASAETVRAAVAALTPGSGYELAFYGGSFTAIPESEQEALLSACIPARESGAVASLRVSTRPDAVTPEKLDRLRRYGVETVELGAQSMCDDVLLCSGRGHTAADTVRAARLIKDAGFSLILQMMTGLPGSDEERDMKTARAVAALRPDGVRIYPTVIIRDTSLEDLWRAGQYREHTVEDAVRICARILPVFENAGIPVIRLGLNPSDELSDGAAVGGAYHPALGELVRSRLWRDRAERLLTGVPAGADVSLAVAANRISVMTGQRRCNLSYLQERFALASLYVCAADVPDGEIIIKLQNRTNSSIINCFDAIERQGE